jgi:anti-sigma regulatory factor (Ser/Thr protein kinase)
MLWDVSLGIDSSLESLRVGRRLVHQLALLAGASETVASEIELSTGEALANAHNHAYPNTVGPVGIEVQAMDSTFSVTIHNGGKEITPPEVPAIPPDRRSLDGRGLYLIGRLMDTVEIGIAPQGHGVILRMTRYL